MKLKIFTDGGSRGNPGDAAIGIVIEGQQFLQEIATTIGKTTNNVAEYTALLTALQELPKLEKDSVERADFFLDSLLVVQQMKGVYAVKDPTLRSLAQQARSIISALPFPITFTHIPRSQNARADALVNKALDEQQAQDLV